METAINWAVNIKELQKSRKPPRSLKPSLRESDCRKASLALADAWASGNELLSGFGVYPLGLWGFKFRVSGLRFRAQSLSLGFLHYKPSLTVLHKKQKYGGVSKKWGP